MTRLESRVILTTVVGCAVVRWRIFFEEIPLSEPMLTSMCGLPHLRFLFWYRTFPPYGEAPGGLRRPSGGPWWGGATGRKLKYYRVIEDHSPYLVPGMSQARRMCACLYDILSLCFRPYLTVWCCPFLRASYASIGDPASHVLGHLSLLQQRHAGYK